MYLTARGERGRREQGGKGDRREGGRAGTLWYKRGPVDCGLRDTDAFMYLRVAWPFIYRATFHVSVTQAGNRVEDVDHGDPRLAAIGPNEDRRA